MTSTKFTNARYFSLCGSNFDENLKKQHNFMGHRKNLLRQRYLFSKVSYEKWQCNCTI